MGIGPGSGSYYKEQGYAVDCQLVVSDYFWTTLESIQGLYNKS